MRSHWVGSVHELPNVIKIVKAVLKKVKIMCLRTH
jgi:hypothetical protein